MTEEHQITVQLEEPQTLWLVNGVILTDPDTVRANYL